MGQTIYEYVVRFMFSAIIVVLLGVVLYKGGIFDLGRFLPNHCSAEWPFYCSNLTITQSSVSFFLVNERNDEANITYLKLPHCQTVHSFLLAENGQKLVTFSGCLLRGKVSEKMAIGYISKDNLFHMSGGLVRGYAR